MTLGEFGDGRSHELVSHSDRLAVGEFQSDVAILCSFGHSSQTLDSETLLRAPSALGNEMPVTRSRSLPVMVDVGTI